jgi:hypothetical protein
MEGLITDLPINPTFVNEADIEFIEPVADYFPPVPEPVAFPSGDSDSDTNLFDGPATATE